MKKIMLFIVTIITFVTLAGCQTNIDKMPTIRGHEITMNYSRLSYFLEGVNLYGKEKDVLYLNQTEKMDFLMFDEEYKASYHQEMYSDNGNFDKWHKIKSKLENENGDYDVDLDVFSSDRYMYFSVNQDYNMDDDYLVKPVYNGKYYVRRDPYQNSFEYLSGTVGIINDFEEDSFLFNDLFYSILTLNNYRFSGLKFYESGNSTTISLKINYNDYLEERFEIIDIFDEIFEFGYFKDSLDFEVVNYKLEYIGVFDRNVLREAGVSASFKFLIDDGEEYVDYSFQGYLTYNSELPDEIKYHDYEHIQLIEDIIKY